MRRVVPLLTMYRMTREYDLNSMSASPSAESERAQTTAMSKARSPFVRLRELLGDTPPGKSAISLAVGEPQHAIPPFVAPIIAAHVAEFGRYPMNKGLDAFAE